MADFDSLRDESYTGSNRCWPCTAVNLGLLALAVVFLRRRERSVAGVLLGVLGVGIIYLRGYLVPYTPVVAPRLVASSPLPDDLFHQAHDTDDGGSLADDVELDGEAVLAELAEAGIIDADDEMLFLTAAVETAWHERMDDLATHSLETLAAEVRRSLDHVDEAEALVADDKEWVVLGEASDLVARPLAVAELAAYRTLEDRVESEALRLAAAESFRMFLEDCPVCGTTLRESSEVSCCGGHTNPRQEPRDTLVCPTCRQRLYAFPAE